MEPFRPLLVFALALIGKFMLRLFALFFCLCFSLSACAQPVAGGNADAGSPKVAPGIDKKVAKTVADVMAQGMPGSSDVRLSASPIPGFVEVSALVNSGRGASQVWTVLQISNDGKIVIDGAIFDAESGVNLADQSLHKVRAEEIERFAASDRIIFKAANEKHRLIVFTNTKCAWCRVLHRNMARYNELGITIEYLPFPRSGKFANADDMNQVWCAKDRQKAITAAKSDEKVESAPCQTPVLMGEDIGHRVGVSGTPAYYTVDGRSVPADARDPAGVLAILDSMNIKRVK